MHPRSHAFRFRLLAIGGAALLLAVAGCQAPARSSAKPSSGPSAPDVRTEANIIEMENQYIADKNSQPTHQHEAEAKAAKDEAAKKAKAGTAKPSEPGNLEN